MPGLGSTPEVADDETSDTERCEEPVVAPAPDEIVVIGGDGEEQQGTEC